jgi:hypothetical protein
MTITFIKIPSSQALNDFLEEILAHAALGTDPVFREFLKRSPGTDAVLRVALLRVIDIAAGGAFPLFHFSPP